MDMEFAFMEYVERRKANKAKEIAAPGEQQKLTDEEEKWPGRPDPSTNTSSSFNFSNGRDGGYGYKYSSITVGYMHGSYS